MHIYINIFVGGGYFIYKPWSNTSATFVQFVEVYGQVAWCISSSSLYRLISVPRQFFSFSLHRLQIGVSSPTKSNKFLFIKHICSSATMYRSILHLLVAALPVAVFAAPRHNSTQNCCQLVDSKIPGRVSYPGSTTYNSSIASYYADQERELSPSCIYRPTTTSDVQRFVQLVTGGNCTNNQFAVRGGGHTVWRGAANIQPGITVDMRVMNSLQLSADRKIASVGGGALWDHIYPQLAPYNLTVLGGRIPGIGVGGFATGGQFIHHSKKLTSCSPGQRLAKMFN